MKKCLSLKQPIVLLLFCAVAAIASPAQRVSTLAAFDYTDGDSPNGDLIQGTDGSFYGLTKFGGTIGYGTVFKVSPKGVLTSLHNFSLTDGEYPSGSMLQAADGNFYGSTGAGGPNFCAKFDYSCGTLFKITSTGEFTNLHNFDGSDGADPVGGLVQSRNGNFYAVTAEGGANNLGAIVEVTPAGLVTVLHSFAGPEGQHPYSGLTPTVSGDFYGTAWEGGSWTRCDYRPCGTIFKITPSGTVTTLHNFCSKSNCADGSNPYGSLTQDSLGNFYGTTEYGGANGLGTVFKITPQGVLTTLVSFDTTVGYFPLAGLVLGTDGSFYGTTSLGGSQEVGTLFKITPQGDLTVLYQLIPEPDWGLVQSTDGNFYGTTVIGGQEGHNGVGSVFRLSVGLGPFAEANPTSGKIGSPVTILGNNLEGSSAVTFNGTPAIFTATSSAIATSVPVGATTGIVEVTTPTGILNSDTKFRVLP